MKNYSDIIIRPILTEKSNLLTESQNKYFFEVSLGSNKIEIKKSIEKRFNVKIKKINTINCKGKNKNMSVRSNGRVIRTNGNRSNWKKAIVTLHPDNTIDLLGGDFS